MPISLDRLREIGFLKWDPIDLMRNADKWSGTPFEDEYDTYLHHVANRISEGAEDKELRDYLVDASCNRMHDGAEPSAECVARASATVHAIRKLANDEDGVI